MTNDVLSGSPSADVPPTTSVYDALAHPRRRRVIHLLRESDAPVSLGELAVCVAADERGVEPAHVDPDAAAPVRTALYHSHLPKLRDAGAVESEPGHHAVVPADLDPFTDFLEAVALDADGP